jgi:hypothetical protein
MVLFLIYPIGIPMFFFILLRMHRHQLRVPKVKHSLGFLYAGYREEFWSFELVDTFHKLFITSILTFIADDFQLSVGMVAVTTYTVIILWTNPYLRPSDDKLHLLANVEILLFLMAGNVFYWMPAGETLNDRDDLTISMSLIFIALGFFGVFTWMAYSVARKSLLNIWAEYKKDRIEKAKQKEEEEEAKALEEGAQAARSDSDSPAPVAPAKNMFNSDSNSDSSDDSSHDSKSEVKSAQPDADSVSVDQVSKPSADSSSSDDSSSDDEIVLPKTKKKPIIIEDSSSSGDSSSD